MSVNRVPRLLVSPMSLSVDSVTADIEGMTNLMERPVGRFA
jgi:hypothetical protein